MVRGREGTSLAGDADVHYAGAMLRILFPLLALFGLAVAGCGASTPAPAGSSPIVTEFAFELPTGVASKPRRGMMRFATAADEILPLRDPRVQKNPAYLPIIVLSRVIVSLEGAELVNTAAIEALPVHDFDFLEALYNSVNVEETGPIAWTWKATPTSYPFTLPHGYRSPAGLTYREGTMRLQTALDTVTSPEPDTEAGKRKLLARIVTALGTLREVGPAVVDALDADDLAYLDGLRRAQNEQP